MMSYDETKEAEAELTAFEPEDEVIELSAGRSDLIARKMFVIEHNEYRRIIKIGDDLSDVPEKFLENLKTENVI